MDSMVSTPSKEDNDAFLRSEKKIHPRGVSRSGLRPFLLTIFHPKIISEQLKTVNPKVEATGKASDPPP